MKIFLDTANVEHIKEANSWGIIDGVTTNPTLIAREGRNFREVVKEICEIVDGPISAEVVSMNSPEMVEEAKELASIHKNVIIKVPLIPEGLKTIKILKGLIPICASCKNIRDDQGYWNQIEAYLQRHSELEFSHGICPECARKLYPELSIQGE